MKLAVVLTCHALSVYAKHARQYRVVFVLPPVVLTVVGVVFTALRLLLLNR